MDNKVTKLFVYGTLLSGYPVENIMRLNKYFHLLGKAQVSGKLYDLGEYPGAIKSRDGFISGELYELNDADSFAEAFKYIDHYEEVDNVDTKNSLFIRDISEVTFAGSITTAWIYWYNQNAGNHPILSSGNYLDYITYNLAK